MPNFIKNFRALFRGPKNWIQFEQRFNYWNQITLHRAIFKSCKQKIAPWVKIWIIWWMREQLIEFHLCDYKHVHPYIVLMENNFFLGQISWPFSSNHRWTNTLTCIRRWLFLPFQGDCFILHGHVSAIVMHWRKSHPN